ncbi:hypothetical protein VNI00_011499 [Paramarasmius palmivorus]|uniref:PARP-type domain-containing protein n=1 Tax=Paramarasmius palmivorus TaxID=297713 RepID=A0AAW0CDK4_9AGAR
MEAPHLTFVLFIMRIEYPETDVDIDIQARNAIPRRGNRLSSVRRLVFLTLLQLVVYKGGYTGGSSRTKIPNSSRGWQVLAVLILDTIQLAMLTESVYTYLVTNYGNPSYLAVLNSSLIGEVMVSNVIAVIVQMFYCWRLWRLSKHNIFVVAIPVALSVASFVLLGYFAGKGLTYHTFLEFKSLDVNNIDDLQPAIKQVVLGIRSRRLLIKIAAITDVAISIAMVGFLHHSKTGFKRSNDMLNRLIIFTFNTGIPVSLSALLAFISINVWKNTFIYMFFFLMQGRLYTNSLLVTLNTREHIREASSRPSQATSGDVYTMGRFAEQTEGDQTPRLTKSTNSPIAIQIDTTTQRDFNTNDSVHSFRANVQRSIAAMRQHFLGYAPSGISRCQDNVIRKNALRVGFGYSAACSAWRHWGCVTPEELKMIKLQIESGTNPDGFDSLKKEDQARFCRAIEVGEIAEEDKEKSDVEASFADNNRPSGSGGGIESLIGRNKRSQAGEEISLSAKRRRVTRGHREESVSSEKDLSNDDDEDIDREFNSFARRLNDNTHAQELHEVSKDTNIPANTKHIDMSIHITIGAKSTVHIANPDRTSLTRLKSPPKLVLADFCQKYEVPRNLQEKLEELQIEGAHGLRFISDTIFLSSKLSVGELALLRDAQERWMEECL